MNHTLLVPRVKNCNNQVLNQYGINFAVEVCLLTKSANSIIGFNSLKSYASVNHLHFHLFYSNYGHLKENAGIEFSFPIQNIIVSYKIFTGISDGDFYIINFKTAKKLVKSLWFLSDQDYFAPGFALQLCDFENDISKFSW